MLISKFDLTDIEQHINEYELKNAVTFPAQYKEFLLKFNGGNTPKTKFKINRVSSNLKGFYGLGNAGEFLNYRLFDRMGKIEEFLEDEMLPVGSNAFGDYLTIGIGTDNNGKVYFIYHDREKRYIELTEDFRTFIGKCKSDEIGHIRTIEERKATFVENWGEDEITQEMINDWQAEIDKYNNMHQEKLVF